MPEEKDVKPEPSPAPKDDVKSEPSPDTVAEKSDSPTEKDVAGSSTDEAKPELSLQDEIENAFAEEKGEEKPNKTKAEEATEKPEEKADEKVEDKVKDPEAAKSSAPTDTDDLTAIPEGVKEGTKAHERFQKLANTNKEQTSEIDTLTGTVNAMRETVKDAGLTPDSFKELIEYARIANSGDPREALKLVDAQRKELLLKIGEKIDPPSLLDDFPELQKRVTDFDLSEEDAIKLASAQTKEKRDTEAKVKAETVQNDEESFQKAVEEYSGVVTAMEEEWQKNDVDYTAKREILMQKLPEIQKQPPSTWPALIKNAYEMITLASASKKLLPQEAPMNKSNTGDGGKKEPSTLGEAIDLALGV